MANSNDTTTLRLSHRQPPEDWLRDPETAAAECRLVLCRARVALLHVEQLADDPQRCDHAALAAESARLEIEDAMAMLDALGAAYMRARSHATKLAPVGGAS